MRSSGAIRAARQRAGLTQRELARRAGVPQSTVARIELGAIDPRASTLRVLLRACGADLEVVDRLGVGVDRSTIVERLRLTPGGRLRELERAWANLSGIRSRERSRT
jgi:transcriptional regulator with XRE-family HTH domain